jgi:tRNA threonylcarbamoyladenosine biosynthesis protein TsaB
MKILGIETSGKIASVAVCDGTNILFGLQENAGRTHSTVLLPLIHEVLYTAGVGVSDLDGIAVGVGPGSYTGVRIGIATVKGIAFSSGLPVCGVSSLEGLAAGACLTRNVAVIKKARNNLCYAAIFTDGKRVMDDKVIDIDEFVTKLRQTVPNGDNLTLTGDLAAVIAEKLGYGALAPDNLNKENAAYICAAARGKPFVDASKLRAAYLERTKAEKDLKA